MDSVINKSRKCLYCPIAAADDSFMWDHIMKHLEDQNNESIKLLDLPLSNNNVTKDKVLTNELDNDNLEKNSQEFNEISEKYSDKGLTQDEINTEKELALNLTDDQILSLHINEEDLLKYGEDLLNSGKEHIKNYTSEAPEEIFDQNSIPCGQVSDDEDDDILEVKDLPIIPVNLERKPMYKKDSSKLATVTKKDFPKIIVGDIEDSLPNKGKKQNENKTLISKKIVNKEKALIVVNIGKNNAKKDKVLINELDLTYEKMSDDIDKLSSDQNANNSLDKEKPLEQTTQEFKDEERLDKEISEKFVYKGLTPDEINTEKELSQNLTDDQILSLHVNEEDLLKYGEDLCNSGKENIENYTSEDPEEIFNQNSIPCGQSSESESEDGDDGILEVKNLPRKPVINSKSKKLKDTKTQISNKVVNKEKKLKVVDIGKITQTSENKKVNVEKKKEKKIEPPIDLTNMITNEDLEYDESSIKVHKIEYFSQQTPEQIKRFISPSYNCPICSEVHQDFGAHMSISHGLVRCGKDRSCQKFFENMEDRSYHEETAHVAGNSATLWKIICGHCKTVKFPDTYTVVEHRYTEHSFFTCTLCSMITTKDEYYNIHMKSHGIRNSNILNLKDKKSLLENLLIYPIAVVNQDFMAAFCYLCPNTNQEGFDILNGGEKLWEHFKIAHKVKNPAEALLRLFNGKQFHFNTLLNDKQRIKEMEDYVNKEIEEQRKIEIEDERKKEMDTIKVEPINAKPLKVEQMNKVEQLKQKIKIKKELNPEDSKTTSVQIKKEVNKNTEVPIKTEPVDDTEVEKIKTVEKASPSVKSEIQTQSGENVSKYKSMQRVACDICLKSCCNRFYLAKHKKIKHGIEPNNGNKDVEHDKSGSLSETSVEENDSSKAITEDSEMRKRKIEINSMNTDYLLDEDTEIKEDNSNKKGRHSNKSSTLTSSNGVKTEHLLFAPTEKSTEENFQKRYSSLECKPGESYYCDICKNSFRDNGDHLCFKHGMVKCGSSRNCHLFFGSYNEKRKHVDEAHADTFSCNPCDKKFSNVYSQLQHRSENHSQLTCMLCFVGFKCQENEFSYFKIHMKTHNIEATLIDSLDEKKLFEKLLGELIVNFDKESMAVSCNLCTKEITFCVEKSGKDLWAHFEKSHKIRNSYEMLHLFNGIGFGFSNQEVKIWTFGGVKRKETEELLVVNEPALKKRRGRPRKVKNNTESTSEQSSNIVSEPQKSSDKTSDDALDDLYGFSASPEKRAREDNEELIASKDNGEKDATPKTKQSKVDLFVSKVDQVLGDTEIPKKKGGRPSKASKMVLRSQNNGLNKQAADVDNLMKTNEDLDNEENNEQGSNVEKKQLMDSDDSELSSDSDDDLPSDVTDSESEEEYINDKEIENGHLNNKQMDDGQGSDEEPEEPGDDELKNDEADYQNQKNNIDKEAESEVNEEWVNEEESDDEQEYDNTENKKKSEEESVDLENGEKTANEEDNNESADSKKENDKGTIFEQINDLEGDDSDEESDDDLITYKEFDNVETGDNEEKDDDESDDDEISSNNKIYAEETLETGKFHETKISAFYEVSDSEDEADTPVNPPSINTNMLRYIFR